MQIKVVLAFIVYCLFGTTFPRVVDKANGRTPPGLDNKQHNTSTGARVFSFMLSVLRQHRHLPKSSKLSNNTSYGVFAHQRAPSNRLHKTESNRSKRNAIIDQDNVLDILERLRMAQREQSRALPEERQEELRQMLTLLETATTPEGLQALIRRMTNLLGNEDPWTGKRSRFQAWGGKRKRTAVPTSDYDHGNQFHDPPPEFNRLLEQYLAALQPHERTAPGGGSGSEYNGLPEGVIDRLMSKVADGSASSPSSGPLSGSALPGLDQRSLLLAFLENELGIPPQDFLKRKTFNPWGGK